MHMYSDPFDLDKEYEDDKGKVFYEKIRNISLRLSPIATSPASPFDEEWPCFFPTVLSSLNLSEVDATHHHGPAQSMSQNRHVGVILEVVDHHLPIHASLLTTLV